MNKRYEIDIVECWQIVRRRWKFIAFVITMITLWAIVKSLLVPNVYQSKVVILPLGGTRGGGALAVMASQISGISMGNFASGQANAQFLAILGSRTLAEDVVKKLDLTKILFKGMWDEKSKKWKGKEPTLGQAADSLASHVKFGENVSNGTIGISAVFTDPILAAEVANAYAEGVREFINKNSLTLAKRNRIFIEGQVQENKKRLLEIGKELNEFYKDGRISNIESRIDIRLVGPEDHIYFAEEGIKLRDISSSGDIMENLEEKRKSLEKKMGGAVIVKDIPQQVYLQYLTLRGELLSQINGLLSQQYEMAKIEEAKKDLTFQIIDPAIVPLGKSGPNRRMIVLLAFAVSIFFAVFIVFVFEYLEKIIGRRFVLSKALSDTYSRIRSRRRKQFPMS